MKVIKQPASLQETAVITQSVVLSLRGGCSDLCAVCSPVDRMAFHVARTRRQMLQRRPRRSRSDVFYLFVPAFRERFN